MLCLSFPIHNTEFQIPLYMGGGEGQYLAPPRDCSPMHPCTLLHLRVGGKGEQVAEFQGLHTPPGPGGGGGRIGACLPLLYGLPPSVGGQSYRQGLFLPFNFLSP